MRAVRPSRSDGSAGSYWIRPASTGGSATMTCRARLT